MLLSQLTIVYIKIREPQNQDQKMCASKNNSLGSDCRIPQKGIESHKQEKGEVMQHT